MEEIHQAMADKPLDYHILKTEGPHFFKGVRSIVDKNDPYDDPLMVVVGGDGTLNHFIQLMEDQEIQQPLGYLPAGAGNDFMRSMDLPSHIPAAIDHIFSVHEARVLDVIQAQDLNNHHQHYGVNSVGFGLDGLANYYFNQTFNLAKARMGRMAYLPLAALAYTRQDSFSLSFSLDGGQTHHFDQVKLCVVVNNPYFGGGVNIYPPAKNNDQVLHLLVADQVSHFDLVNILPQVLIKKKALDHPKIHIYDFQQGQLKIGEGPVGQKDGEVIHSPMELDIQIIRRQFWL